MINLRQIAVFLLVFFLALFLGLQSAGAQSFWNNFHWSYGGGVLFLAADNGPKEDPAQFTPSLSFFAAYPFFKNFRIQITEDIFFANYYYKDYPIACNPESRLSHIITLATGIQAVGFFPISDNDIAIHTYGGLSMDIRIITQAFGLHPDDQTDAKMHTEAINKYFWGNGRFLSAAAGVGMDFPVNAKFLLGFDLRVWYPLYRLWTNEDIPFIDGWRFSAGLRITPRSNKEPSAARKKANSDEAEDDSVNSEE